jgi:predicted nucleic acid-binding protein
MASVPVLVDSSFYIRQAREGRDPLKALTLGAAATDLATCGIVRSEVGRGIKDPKVRALFTRFWDVMLYVPTDDRLWLEVEELSWRLDRSGTCLPLPDLIIACCARRIGAAVLTFDGHFERVPGLRVIDRID